MTLPAEQERPSSASSSAARAAVEQLRQQRDEVLVELAQLTEQECRLPATWANTQRTVNFLLRAFSLHEIDHLQHVTRLLRDRGVAPGEAHLILLKAQALRGEMEALLLGLTDEEFEAAGPGDAWSARQVVEHLANTDRNYLNNVRKALAEASKPDGASA